MKLKHCLFILGLFFSAALSAQDTKDYVPVGFDVCGIELGQKLPHSEFVAKFGTPDKYRSYETEFGLDEEYDYGHDNFHCEEGGHISRYSLFDSRFAVLTKYLEGGIRVGDGTFIMVVKNYVIVSIHCAYSV